MVAKITQKSENVQKKERKRHEKDMKKGGSCAISGTGAALFPWSDIFLRKPKQHSEGREQEHLPQFAATFFHGFGHRATAPKM